MSSLRLHHIGHAVADLAAGVAGYRLRFGYREVSPPIHDPAQTAIVQFLELPPDAGLIELVAPDGPASKLSAVVKRGGGLHHLCYTSARLEDAVDALSETGLRLIADPTAAAAFDGRRICWLLGPDRTLIELIERRNDHDLCFPGAADPSASDLSGKPG